MCIMYWPMPVMNVVVPYYYLEAKVVNYLLLSWPCPWSRVFMRAGFVIPLLVSLPSNEY